MKLLHNVIEIGIYRKSSAALDSRLYAAFSFIAAPLCVDTSGSEFKFKINSVCFERRIPTQCNECVSICMTFINIQTCFLPKSNNKRKEMWDFELTWGCARLWITRLKVDIVCGRSVFGFGKLKRFKKSNIEWNLISTLYLTEGTFWREKWFNLFSQLIQ